MPVSAFLRDGLGVIEVLDI